MLEKFFDNELYKHWDFPAIGLSRTNFFRGYLSQ